MQKKWAFLVILILSTLVYAETSYNFLTKGFADTLYCRINGDCVLNSLNVTTFNAVNITSVNYNVTGVVNAYGYNINGTNIDDRYVNIAGDTMTGDLHKVGSFTNITITGDEVQFWNKDNNKKDLFISGYDNGYIDANTGLYFYVRNLYGTAESIFNIDTVNTLSLYKTYTQSSVPLIAIRDIRGYENVNATTFYQGGVSLNQTIGKLMENGTLAFISNLTDFIKNDTDTRFLSVNTSNIFTNNQILNISSLNTIPNVSGKIILSSSTIYPASAIYSSNNIYSESYINATLTTSGASADIAGSKYKSLINLPVYAGFTPVNTGYYGIYNDITFIGRGKSAGVPNVVGMFHRVNYSGQFDGQFGMGVPIMMVRGYYDNYKSSTSSTYILLDFKGYFKHDTNVQYVSGMTFDLAYEGNSTSTSVDIINPTLSKPTSSKINGYLTMFNSQFTGVNISGDVKGYYTKLYDIRNGGTVYGFYSDVYNNINTTYAFYAKNGLSLFKNTTIEGYLNVTGNVSIQGNIDVKNNITGNLIYGEMWNKSYLGFETVDLVTPEVYVKVMNLTASSLNGFNVSGGNLTATRGGVYDVTVKIGATASAIGGEYGMKVYINDVGQDDCYDHEEPSTAPIGFIASCIVTMNAGDRLNVRFDDHADPVRDITLLNANVKAIRLGG